MNGFTIRLQPRWSRYYPADYEKGSYKYFRNVIKPGDVVLDVGAHIGVYTVPFSELVGPAGKVYSFEPTPSTYKIFLKTIHLNGCSNVFPLNAAVAEKNGEIRFNLTNADGKVSNANSIVKLERTVASITVKMVSIDNFRKEHSIKVNVAKIDVEGAEYLVLIGGKNMFLEDRPCGILALHPENIKKFGHSLKQIWDCLMEYKLIITRDGVEISEQSFCSQLLLFDVEFKSK
ncbi:MAG: FkbM family methyltransferase [Flavobacteriales bacterium]